MENKPKKKSKNKTLVKPAEKNKLFDKDGKLIPVAASKPKVAATKKPAKKPAPKKTKPVLEIDYQTLKAECDNFKIPYQENKKNIVVRGEVDGKEKIIAYVQESKYGLAYRTLSSKKKFSTGMETHKLSTKNQLIKELEKVKQ